MAITTIPGASSADLTTLQGTSLADTFPALNANNLYVDGLEGNDTITGATAIESVTIDAGADNDTLTFTAEVLKSKVTLGGGNDKINLEDFSGSIYGGAGQTLYAAATRNVTNSLIVATEAKTISIS